MTIFNKIGNFFNKNGNTVGKVMTATGATAMGVAGMGMMWRAMNSSSIFGGCGCMPMGGMPGMSPFGMGGFGMGGMSPFGMGGMSPFGMGGMSPFGMGGMSPFGMGGYNMGGCSVFGGMNQMFGLQQAFMSGAQYVGSGNYQNNPWGLLNGSYNFNTTTKSSLSDIDLDEQKRYNKVEYDVAELAENEGDEDKGKKLDKKFNELNEGEIKNIQLKAEGEDYATGISNMGKNYVRAMDTNGDGIIKEDEYVAFEKENNERLAKIDDAEDYARLAFRKMDLNQDGKVDWKEMGAVMATFDENDDGKITQSEYTNMANNLTKLKDNTFESKMKASYNTYFKDKDES